MSTFDERVLSLTPGKRIELYKLDLTDYGGHVFKFTTSVDDCTPADVALLSDTGVGNTYGVSVALPMEASGGDELLVEAFLRVDSGSAYPALHITADQPDGTPFGTKHRASVFVNPETMECHAEAYGTTFGAPGAAASMAGEFIYVSARVLMGADTPVRINVEPAATDAGAWPVRTAGLQGACEVFGLRAYFFGGGLRIPALYSEAPEWAEAHPTYGGGSVLVRENFRMATKVPVWQGEFYTPLPIKATGFERSGTGPFPKPTLSMSNVGGSGSLLINYYGDIRGATVTRTRLFADNLDNGVDPDPASYFQPDVFRVNRRTRHNREEVVFELVSALDQQGVMLPGRQVLRDVCPWIYRQWNTSLNGGAGGFEYQSDDTGCPYTGTNYFDAEGNSVTNPEDDVCSRKLATGCRKRYGKAEVLPLGSFPMVGRQNS